ncbi:MAG: CotH kinase family protein [Anaerotignum sp.]|nr:CotH kinase family protein [Anaerotignum sp.]
MEQLKKRIHKNILAILIGFTVVFMTGCSLENQDAENEPQQAEQETTNTIQAMDENAEIPIVDNNMLYVDDDDSVVTMYLTVRQGNAAENTNHTWEEINGHSVYYYEDLGIERYQVEGILQVGDENGPVEGELGYGASVPNTIISIRGQTSSTEPVKSYKISIKDEKGSWRDQKVINLNKHAYDGVRFRNKLCYDLMKTLPGMISLRTQFVHLYVKDETVEGNAKFQDCGLYTQVEQPNKTFLKNHGLDKFGQLYKINFFEFFQYEDTIMLKSDANYDVTAFEKLLEIKGDDDHSKLIAMLKDVNDYSKPIEEVFGKWFNEDNFFSWLAFHILVGNVDTQSRNTLIYSPLNVNKWYFISWDNDYSFKLLEMKLDKSQVDDGWEYGISNYWSNVLYRRILKSEYYRNILDHKIEEYRKIITEDRVTTMVANYNAIAWKYRNSLPDILHNRLTNEEYLQVCDEMPTEIEKNYEAYKKSLEAPMPFYIGVPSTKDGKLYFDWDVAYDFDAENITYDFELAKDYTFSAPIEKAEGLNIPEFETNMLAAGQYFIKVLAENESGYMQYAFDYYNTEHGAVFGVKCFYVLPDGSIVEDVYEEGE